MPSVSVLSQMTFSNLGPLTTTFTAPSSCSTLGRTGIGLTDFPTGIFWDTNCSIDPSNPEPSWSCFPEGSAPSPTATQVSANDYLQVSYFSPGLYCPSGWKTVGAAVRDGDSISSNGAFNYYTTPIPTSIPGAFPDEANLLMQVLADGETAALCCPSSMTGQTDIGCYATLPSYTPSTGCLRYFPEGDLTQVSATYWFDGVTVVGEVESLIATSPITSIISTTFTAVTATGTEEATSYIGVTMAPMVILVHKEADLTDATATSNAAMRLGWSSVWDRDLGLVLLVSMLGMLLGVVIILPF
ncbi:uncharacterized protein N7483_003765 [Penicillium malachiteum]|uniref:uncharacterized protein n=1 Tax=Penicillium malachiteum TaxID=1324776 RepID=UPI00254789BE|nr:uncharacterized protein N7483_003765 [Penicillium malachiteum]KAJ5729257.1 hypothetical protein N7483_003765 [Penicillium malachiteum]